MIHHSRRLIQLLSCYLDYRTGGSLLDSRPGALLKSAEVSLLRGKGPRACSAFWRLRIGKPTRQFRIRQAKEVSGAARRLAGPCPGDVA
jgi:hypothetical protein